MLYCVSCHPKSEPIYLDSYCISAPAMRLTEKEKEAATLEQLRDNAFYRCVCKHEKNICKLIDSEYDKYRLSDN